MRITSMLIAYSAFVKSGHRADHFRLNGNLDPALPRDRFIATQ